MIILTLAAREAIISFMGKLSETLQGIRVIVVRRPNMKPKLSLKFDNASHDDVVVRQGGIDVIVQRDSVQHVDGLTLDYSLGATGAGFRFLGTTTALGVDND